MATDIILGKLIKQDDLRSVWKNEATDFTVWLAEPDNLNLLGDTLGIEINLIQREAPAGAFSIDIYAEEANSGRKIIIENQLENSNHDHLGKIITYASAKQAEIVIWVVKKARDEHKQAIEWLNEKTDEDIEFYLLEIELWKIGDSAVAPKFSIISAPNGWMKNNKAVEKIANPLQSLQIEYWEKFLEYAETNCEYVYNKHLTANARTWMNIKTDTSKCYIALTTSPSKKQLKAMIYFYYQNREAFERFKDFEEEINQKCDNKLEWITWKKDSTIRLVEHVMLKKIIDEYKDK